MTAGAETRSGARIDICLICGAKYHDTDFARVELLNLLINNPDIRVRVFEDYSNTEAIRACDGVITYTCDLIPPDDSIQALKDHLTQGKRWFALHATNSVIEFLDDGRVNSPKDTSGFTDLLGSQFIAHPPIQPFTVEPTGTHWLTDGIKAFTVSDELYLSELNEQITPLLVTHYSGKAQEGFVAEDWPGAEPRPVMYLHDVGKGAVLYLTLGHCRSRYDMQPLMDEYPDTERCAWETKEFYTLLNRGIEWVCRD